MDLDEFQKVKPNEIIFGRYKVRECLGVGSLCSAHLVGDLERGEKTLVLKVLGIDASKERQIVDRVRSCFFSAKRHCQ